jgi:hypothetical protein
MPDQRFICCGVVDRVFPPGRPKKDPRTSPLRLPVSLACPGRSRSFSPTLKFLLVAGVPLGFNGLIIIRARKGSMPRTTAVAIIPLYGRRLVWAPRAR